MIKKLLKQYGEEKKVKKWDFLYKTQENDQNLYFITKWKILLLANHNQIAIVWENEISGEKSFLSNNPKEIDAQAITNVEVLYLTPSTFSKLPNNVQINILKSLTIFVSNRVYLLNNIIDNISTINKKLESITINLNLDYLQNIFNNLVKIKSAYIYKSYSWALLPIFESNIEPNIQTQISKIEDDINVSLSENKLIIRNNPYTFLFEIEKKANDYIIINTIMHSINTIKYLGESLENLKKQELNSFLD